MVVGLVLLLDHVEAAELQDFVRPLPQLLGHDRRYDLSALILINHPFVLWQKTLFLREHIDDLHLVADIVAHVLGILDDVRHRWMWEHVALGIANAIVIKIGFEVLHAVLAGGVQLEQLPDDRRLFLVNIKPLVSFAVAEDIAVAQHHAVFDRLMVSPTDARADLAAFVLCHWRHDGQAEFAVLVERVDVVVLKVDRYAVTEQLARILDAVEGVTSESGDLLGDDQIELPRQRVVDHLVEFLTLFGRYAWDTLVDVAARKLPVRHIADVFGEVFLLVFKRIELFHKVRADAGIVGDPERQILKADPVPFDLISDR